MNDREKWRERVRDIRVTSAMMMMMMMKFILISPAIPSMSFYNIYYEIKFILKT